jgi:hypothetical protein
VKQRFGAQKGVVGVVPQPQARSYFTQIATKTDPQQRLKDLESARSAFRSLAPSVPYI